MPRLSKLCACVSNSCILSDGLCEKHIYHNQFNVIDSATLRLAQEHPQDYTDLIVRVAGYCAQFVSLMPEAQEAIIARTENTW